MAYANCHRHFSLCAVENHSPSSQPRAYKTDAPRARARVCIICIICARAPQTLGANSNHSNGTAMYKRVHSTHLGNVVGAQCAGSQSRVRLRSLVVVCVLRLIHVGVVIKLIRYVHTPPLRLAVNSDECVRECTSDVWDINAIMLHYWAAVVSGRASAGAFSGRNYIVRLF